MSVKDISEIKAELERKAQVGEELSAGGAGIDYGGRG